MRLRGGLAKIVVVLLATAAAVAQGDAPAEEFDLRGRVVRVAAAPRRGQGAVLRTIVVDGYSPASRKLKAVVRVTDKTKLFARGKGHIREAGTGDLRRGRLVEIKFSGPVEESYPVQVTAAEVVILEEGPVR